MAHDVFVSYANEDKATTDALVATLEQHQIRCWIAPRDVPPGADWAEEIIGAIGGSRVMVLVFSASANDSPQVMREVERAVNKGVTIVPFRIEDVTPSRSIEFFISGTHWLDALTPPLQQHLDRLAETVQSLLGREPSRTARAAASAGGVKPPSSGITGFARHWRDRPLWILAVGAALVGGIAALFMVVDSVGSGGADEPTATPTSSATPTRSPSTQSPTATATPTPELALRLPDCLKFSDAPEPCIEEDTDIDVPDRVSPGDPIPVTILAKNIGLNASVGVITVSSPDAQEIRIAAKTLPNGTISVPAEDNMSICEQFGGGVCKADDIRGGVSVIYPIAEAVGAWNAGDTQMFETVVVPKPGASTVTIHIRISLLSTDWYIYPPSATTTLGVQPAGIDEQQGFPVLKYTVEIAPPAGS